MKHTEFLSRCLRNAAIFGVIAAIFCACNKKKDSEPSVAEGTLAVTAFKLKTDAAFVGIDSVYFAIDLNRGIIYNPDSLPPETAVNKLIPVITYPSSVKKATIVMEGGTTREGEVDYKKNPTDSIDFTGRVTFILENKETRMEYAIKVNVHKQYADSLHWGDKPYLSLPARHANPKAQKTVSLSDSTAVCLIHESDGTYTLAESKNLKDNAWTSRQVTFDGFTPRVETLAATDDNILYILAADGSLYQGDSKGSGWTSTGRVWKNMIGAYTKSVVGLRDDNGRIMFDQYPMTDINPCEIPTDFPVAEFSNFVTLKNKWTLSPVAILTCGRKSDGSLSKATWGFDGREWVVLNHEALPALSGPAMIPYYYYRKTSAVSTEYKVWMLLGGRKEDNSLNRTVYISYDNGVNWTPGNKLLQLPEAMPSMTGCDNVVLDTKHYYNLSANWTKGGNTRVSYEVVDTEVIWECPYIYLIGGYDAQGNLYDTIWRGVLARLSFVPII